MIGLVQMKLKLHNFIYNFIRKLRDDTLYDSQTIRFQVKQFFIINQYTASFCFQTEAMAHWLNKNKTVQK